MLPIAVQKALAEASKLHFAGQLNEAAAIYRSVLESYPRHTDVLHHLGAALLQAGDSKAAVELVKLAIGLNPNVATYHNTLGFALAAQNQVTEAIASYEAALKRDPNMASAYLNMGIACRSIGMMDQTVSCYRKLVALTPDDHLAYEDFLYSMLFSSACQPAEIFEEHLKWSRRFAAPLQPLTAGHPNHPELNRRLRIGYVSPDFWSHAVARHIICLLENHDHTQFEIFCYSNVAKPDQMTERMRATADTWRDILNLTDDQVAQLIRDDRIDILIDLAGHTDGNRILVFARKPAPLQMMWPGYPATSGLSTMDYYLTDAFADPPGMVDGHFSERLIRFPKSAWCWAPTDEPAVMPGPSQRGEPVTFGSFNQIFKLSEFVLRLWAKILERVPNSRLLIKATAVAIPAARQRIEQIFSSEGIALDRLIFRAFEPTRALHMAVYGDVDIALDSYPYHGTATTCDALWMGVPVVTLAGPSHVARVSVSILNNVGLSELVAENVEQYLSIATSLAQDPQRIAHLRSTMRERLLASTLMDARQFARSFEEAYRTAWADWCQSRSPA